MDKEKWNQVVLRHASPFGAFLQSWDWGEFQKSQGREVERLYKVSAAGTVAAQAIKIPLPLGHFYWSFSKAPFGDAGLDDQIEFLREELDEGMFFRLEPRDDPGFIKVKDMQPSSTTVLDLTKGEEALLTEMKPKTRYNIRLSAKKGVVCRKVGLDHFDDFVRLMEQTTKRDKFRAHEAGYYRKMLEILNDGDTSAFLAMAFFEDRPLAAFIVIDFGGVRTYLHGASSNLHRNVMAPYALHMFLIRDALHKGMSTFDFWGTAPEGSSKKHPWHGITRYKLGFNGEIVSMPGTFELPIKHTWYSFYRTLKKIRSWRI